MKNPNKKQESNNESYFTFSEDLDLIEGDFQREYHINLEAEIGSMNTRRFLVLLSSLSPDSLFKRIVNIRAEKDYQAIRNFSKWEREIYDEWKNRNKAKEKPEVNNVITKDTLEALFK